MDETTNSDQDEFNRKKLEALAPLLYEVARRADKLGVDEGRFHEFEVTIDEHIWASIEDYI